MVSSNFFRVRVFKIPYEFYSFHILKLINFFIGLLFNYKINDF